MKVGENPKVPYPPCGRSIKTCARGNVDAPSTTKYGSPVRLDAQIVALHPHCAKGAPSVGVGLTMPMLPPGGGHLPGRRGHDPLALRQATGRIARGVVAGAGLGGGGGSPLYLPEWGPLWRWHGHLYATGLRGSPLAPTSPINVITTPLHWITDVNARVDAATQDPPEVDLTWLLRRPFSFVLPVTYGDQCKLSPTALSDWLQEQASIPARVGYEARWGANYTPGSVPPLDWFDSD